MSINERLPNSIVVLGAGGLAEIIFWSLRDQPHVEEILFVEDEGPRSTIEVMGRTYQIKKDWDFSRERANSRFDEGNAFRHFVLAVAYPEQKKVFVEKALNAGLVAAPTIVDPSAVVSPDVSLGSGGYISALTSIVPGCRLGDYVTLATNTSIGHHCSLGDFSFCAQGVTLLGNVSIEEGVWLGGGAVVRDCATVSPWIKVGSQAYVSKDIEKEGMTYVGVPARMKKTE